MHNSRRKDWGRKGGTVTAPRVLLSVVGEHLCFERAGKFDAYGVPRFGDGFHVRTLYENRAPQVLGHGT